MIIEQWIRQRCIGYQHEDNTVRSVMEGQVKLTDGTTTTVWFLSWIEKPGYFTCTSGLLDTCPRIDIPLDNDFVLKYSIKKVRQP